MRARLRRPAAPPAPAAKVSALPRLEECFLRLDAVRHLVRDLLGCECPEEVFDDILVAFPASLGPRGKHGARSVVPGSVKLVVGGRLLVVLVPVAGRGDIAKEARALLVRGRATRDQCGLNRFRLVLVGVVPADVLRRLQAAAARVDERTHVHAVSAGRLSRRGAG